MVKYPFDVNGEFLDGMHAHAIYTRLIAFLPLCEKSGGLVLKPHAVVDYIIKFTLLCIYRLSLFFSEWWLYRFSLLIAIAVTMLLPPKRKQGGGSGDSSI